MEDTTSTSRECSNAAIKNGTANAVLIDDVLLRILEDHVAGDHVGYHALKPYLRVCRLFRNTLLERALSFVILDEPKYINCIDSAGAKNLLEQNKRIYGFFAKMLKERPDIKVRTLSICTVCTDRELVQKHYQILRLCAGNLSDLHLNLQEVYERRELWSILSRVNPHSITFYEHIYPNEDYRSKWSIVDVFLIVHGCTNLRYLAIPYIYQDGPVGGIPEALGLELPLETLHCNNHFWHRQELTSLHLLKLPNLKEFKGTVLADDDDDRDIFRQCVTRNWVKTLITLDLSCTRLSHRWRPTNRQNIFDVHHDTLPNLKKLYIASELLCPCSLFAFSTLENIRYSNVGLPDLKELAETVMVASTDPKVPLPHLRTFELYNCTLEAGALGYIDFIRLFLKKRGITLKMEPSRRYSKLLERHSIAESAIEDIHIMY